MVLDSGSVASCVLGQQDTDTDPLGAAAGAIGLGGDVTREIHAQRSSQHKGIGRHGYQGLTAVAVCYFLSIFAELRKGVGAP